MNPRTQPAPFGGKRSVVGNPPSAGEKGDQRYPVLFMPASSGAYITSLDRTLLVLLSLLILAVATTGAWGADGPQERPWRVLLVHSFGSSAPPFTTHSTAFESTLKRELGTAVDLDEVSLDMARYAQPDMEDAFAEFLGKRMAAWEPDLVVPIGSPAGRFVAKFRDKLFPQTPVIYTGMDRRTLPADAFANNATFVGENFDLKGLVEDMLQLVPETNNIVVILGATPLERYWTEEFRQAFAPFMGRVKFAWVNDLSFDQMLDLVSKLPPRSFVLLGLLMRDASGVTYNEDFALARLHAVSRAPINGMFQHEVGMGIVGGRLYQGELEGVESARVAARILRGEPASRFPPLEISPSLPTYDWRELTRWGISESRLPPGSVVMFRQPTLWDRYRWPMIGTVALIAAQAVLISALLIQRRRRNLAQQAQKQAQAEVQLKQDQMGLAAEAANAAMWVWDVTADDLWMTEQGRSLFGFQPDVRITFAATMDRVHPADRAARESAVTRALETRGGYEIEYRLLEPSGVVRWIHGRARCVEPSDGTGLKLVGVSMEITARKQAEALAAQEHEELRKKRAELEHVARVATLGELTTTVVHEIAQPLAAILVNSSAGIDFLDAPQPDLREARAALCDIGADTERAAEVIRRLRSMLKRDTPGFTSFDLNQLIRDVDRMVHGDAVTHNVTVELDLWPGVLPVQADNVQLQQVMLNLMLNAFSALDEVEPNGERRLIVRTKSMDASNVLVELQDNGPGIAPDTLESIFDAFVTSKSNGLGIGLAISRTIVERHNGKVWAANNPDRGATFSIMLPMSASGSNS
jgi:C4-dicarboxylate-specific signal transduction histidine kinase